MYLRFQGQQIPSSWLQNFRTLIFQSPNHTYRQVIYNQYIYWFEFVIKFSLAIFTISCLHKIITFYWNWPKHDLPRQLCSCWNKILNMQKKLFFWKILTFLPNYKRENIIGNLSKLEIFISNVWDDITK